MSDVISAIRQILLRDAEVKAITKQIFSDHLPQSITGPSVVLWSIGGESEEAVEKPLGFEINLVQTDCYAATRGTSMELWKAVRRALNGYRGVVEGVRIDGINTQGGHQHREDRTLAATDSYRYRVIQDFNVPYHVYEVT